jgi:Arc/MetJ-type ribon-helix-helix transcriptional regulator
MSISLSPETQKLLKERMEAGRYASEDDLIRDALETMHPIVGPPFDHLDAETRAAIEEGLAQAERGEGIPIEQALE